MKVVLGTAVASLAMLGSGLATGSAPAQQPADDRVRTTNAKPVVLRVDMAQGKDANAKAPACCWGAIKMAKDGAYGVGHTFSTKRAAYRRAGSECNRRTPFVCKRVVATHNSWAAAAVRMRNGRVQRLAYSYNAPNESRARGKALNVCERDGGQCHVRGVVFSGTP